MRRIRTLVAAFLAFWVPALVGLPMSMAGSSSGMADMGAMTTAAAPANGAHGVGGATGARTAHPSPLCPAPAHHAPTDHDCCMLCPCCSAVASLPAPIELPAAAFAPVAVPAFATDVAAPASSATASPPVRGPPTLRV